jgi:hypothetical protein
MVLRGLPWKSTSQAFDEAICIAQLRCFDIKPLPQLSGEYDEAMKLLMKMQHSFPRNYVFAKARRMAEDGYGWAPRSFLANCVDQRDVERMRVTRELALFSSEGLAFSYPGILLSPCKPLPLEDRGAACFVSMPAHIENLKANSDGISSEEDYSHACEITFESRKDEAPPLSGPMWENTAIIVEAPAGLPIDERTIASGVMAVVKRHGTVMIHARFVCAIAWRRLEMNRAEKSYWAFDMDNAQRNIIMPARILPADQGWCLS